MRTPEGFSLTKIPHPTNGTNVYQVEREVIPGLTNQVGFVTLGQALAFIRREKDKDKNAAAALAFAGTVAEQMRINNNQQGETNE